MDSNITNREAEEDKKDVSENLTKLGSNPSEQVTPASLKCEITKNIWESWLSTTAPQKLPNVDNHEQKKHLFEKLINHTLGEIVAFFISCILWFTICTLYIFKN